MRTSKKRSRAGDGMKAEYDFSAGVRGKYAAQLTHGSNLVLLAPDVAEFFKTAKAVNDALRSNMKSKPAKKHSRRRRIGKRPGR
jgi:hypothetical protein